MFRSSVELHADCFQLRAENSLVLWPKKSLLLVELLSIYYHLKFSEAFHQTSHKHLHTILRLLVDTELICRVNCSIQKFCVRRIRIDVYGLLDVLLPQDSTSPWSNTFEYWMSRFLELFHPHVSCVLTFSLSLNFLFSSNQYHWTSTWKWFDLDDRYCVVPLTFYCTVVMYFVLVSKVMKSKKSIVCSTSEYQR